ncbi:MAG: 30S ribosomal protein S2 [Patescibacteria group bacterium]
MKEISLVEMLKAGVHFGHQKSRWHPKMRQYIFTARNGIHIINLEKTKEKLLVALDFARETAKSGGVILFVGTKRQAKMIVKKYADLAGMPYVIERWIGGTFTNYETVQKLIKKYNDLVAQQKAGELAKYTKKEQLKIGEKIKKMEKIVGGINTLSALPAAVFVVDLKHDQTAAKEAKKRNITIIGLTDTNVSPEGIKYVIPANDDATKSIELITSLIAEAIIEGKGQRADSAVVTKASDNKKEAIKEDKKS